MDEQITTTYNPLRGKSKWASFICFMASSIFIALSFYFLSSGFIYTFMTNGEPVFAIPAKLLLWMVFGYLVVLGTANFMIFSLSKNLNTYGMRLTLLLFYIFMLMILVWSMFSFTLKMPTLGVIVLGLAIAFGIYLTYRYLTRSIVAGSLLSLFILNLIYIFATQLGYVLIV